MRILVVAHGHPDISVGGGERAAYDLFRHLKAIEGIEPTFIARGTPAAVGHDGWFGAFRGREDELLWVPPAYDWLRRTSASPAMLRRQVGALVDRLRPDVVHVQHYQFIGLDALRWFKEISGCRTILTLHEYLLICHHDGQMVKTADLRLCHEAAPADCHACFPDVASGKFFVRARSIQQWLASADRLVSPSRFLRDRHVAWGVHRDRISVIENPLPPEFEDLPATLAADRHPNPLRVRLGYFGQLTRFKGAFVLFEAIRHLPPDVRERVEVVLFGARLEEQPAEFQDAVRRYLAESPGSISLYGRYQHRDVTTLMRSVDWVVVPSTWWENSPLVIQEARAVGTPVLTSNIGGMAEKVRDGIDGLHFLAGSPLDLAARIEAIVRRHVNVEPPRLDVRAQNRESIAAYLDAYRGVPRGADMETVRTPQHSFSAPMS
jgi:glycosyltransferase involved in cell wall biosynthesis